MFTDLVNISDEALVMQVVKFYFPRWDRGEEEVEDDESEEGSTIGSKHSGGAEKGERLTCSRTASAFYGYCRKVKAARESSFKTKWNEKLQGEVIKQHKKVMEEERRKREERDDNAEKENDGGIGSEMLDADMVNGTEWGNCFGIEELPPHAQV